MRDKIELTRQLVAKLPEDEWTFEQARTAWWYNIRDGGGMRLTFEGYRTFVKDLELTHYEFEIPATAKFTYGTILALDHRLQTPYYIVQEKHRFTKLVFFGSKEAVLVNLYGDLEKFLANYN